MLKAYKFRIYPNQGQKECMTDHFGCVRHVYNWALFEKKTHYEHTKESLSKSELQKRLVASKKIDKPWLKEVNSQSLLSSLLHLDSAFNNFFKGRTKFPKIKKKQDGWQSFQCPQHVKIDHNNHLIDLPKIKGIKIKLHRPFEGKIKTCTIKKTPQDHYYISILVDNSETLPPKLEIKKATTVGVDVGIKEFVITSDERKYANNRFLSQALSELKKRQRQLSRSKKGSKTRNKKRKVVAKKHDQVSKQRMFYHHHVANQLLSENQAETIAFEDLHIKGMMKNRKLARSISDVAWSGFVNIVQYKAEWQGKNVIFCNRFAPSSKQCTCGYKNKELRLSDRFWRCPECNEYHDRDILAANNIKFFAIADALGQSVCIKQSPCSDRFSKPAISKGQDNSVLSGHKKPPLES